MRLFWMAWSLAVLLVLAAIGISAWVFAASENGSDLIRIVSRSACGVVLLFAFVGAFRLALLATASLRFVLAQNLAALIVMELDELRQNAEERAVALARDSMVRSQGKVRGEWQSLGSLPIPRFFGERHEIRKLLGHATQETLEELLASLESYNQIVDVVKDQPANENAVVVVWQGIWAVESKLKQAARDVAPFCLAD